MSENILILGAGISYVDNIRAAKRAGYEVIATDRNSEAPGFEVADESAPVDITDVTGTLEIAREYDVVGIVPMNDYGVPTAAAVAAELGLVGIDPSVARTCTDKAAMRERWDEAGVPQPSFGVATIRNEAKSYAIGIGLPVVIKPVKSTGGGSRGVSVVEHLDELNDAFEFAQSVYDDDDRVLIEECVDGSEHSIEVVVTNDETTVVAASDKEKTQKPYRVDKSVIYPTNSPERATIYDFARRSVEALGIDVGPAHVELAVADDGPKLFELGARVGGGATADLIVPATSGVDYFRDLIKLYAGDTNQSFEPTREDGVTYRFLTPKPGMVQVIEGVETIREWHGVLDCRIWIEPGDEVVPVKVGADRSGSIITHAETRAQAIELVDRAEDHIDFVYESE